MPSQLHFLFHYNSGLQSLHGIIGKGKRFVAYDLISRLKQKKGPTLLAQLQAGVQQKDRRRGKLHGVWIDSFDVKDCRTKKFILQKVGYIHKKPVRSKWKLAVSSIEYPHFSALFYTTRTQRFFPVREYRDFVKQDTMYDDFGAFSNDI